MIGSNCLTPIQCLAGDFYTMVCRGHRCDSGSCANEHGQTSQWYQGETSLWRTCIFSVVWHAAKPRSANRSICLYCTVVAIWMNITLDFHIRSILGCLFRTELQVSAWDWASIPLYGFRNLNFMASLDHAWFALNLIHAIIVGIVFFIILQGDCTLHHLEHLYIYIHAWLLVQGVSSQRITEMILIKCVCVYVKDR